MKKMKLIGGIAAVVVVLICVLFYVVSQKINTEDLKKMIETKVEEALPGTDVSIEELSYRLGTQATVTISKLDIKSLAPFKGKKELFSVNQVYLNIPFGAILFGGGTIDLEIDSPEVLLVTAEETSNWQKVMKKTEESPEATPSTEVKKESKTELPSFIANSKINLRFSNISLKLIDAKKESSFLVEKILVKNFGISSKSAFEVASKLSFSLSEKEIVKSEILVIGQFDTQAFFESGKINASLVVDIKDIEYPSPLFTIPNIHGDMSINLVEETLSFEAKFKGANLFDFDMNASNTEKELNVSDIKFNIDLDKMGQFIKDETLLKMISFNGSVFRLTGGLTLDKAKDLIVPKLRFETTKPILIKEKGLTVSNSLKGDLSNTDLKASLKTELLGGLILSSVNMVLDLSDVKKGGELLNTIFISTKGSNLRITRKLVDELVYQDKPNAKPVPVEAENAPVAEVNFPELPKVNITLDFSPIFLDDESVDIKGKMFTRKNEFGTKDFTLKVGKGLGYLDVNGRIQPKKLTSQVDFKMTSLNLLSINTLLPKFISQFEGIFNGSVKGSVTKTKELSYNMAFNVSARDGELKNLNLASFITPYIDKISFLKGKIQEKDLNVTDRFKLMETQGTISENLLDLTRFNFVSEGKSVDIKANGKVYLVDSGSSRIYADIKDKSGKLNKAINGVDTLPILLEGKGLGITPNFSYTTNKVGKTAVKAAAKKEVNKAIEKNKDKIKDAGKKLLKGLFK